MVFEQVEGGFEVGDGGEVGAVDLAEEFGAFEAGGGVGVQPFQDGSGALVGGVDAHGVEDHQGVGLEVVAQAHGGVQGVGVDGAGPSVVGVGGQVQQSGDAGGGAVVLSGPFGDVGQGAAAVEGVLGVLLVVGHQGVGLGGQRQDGGVGPVGECQGQGGDGAFVGLGDGFGDGGGEDLSAADQGLGQGVEEAGEQAAAVEALVAGDVFQDGGLQGQAHGQGGVFDVFAAGLPVDLEQVSGVAFEEDLHVGGAAGVAAGDGVEDAALGGEHRQASSLFGEQGGDGFGGGVVGDQLRARGHGGGFGGLG